MKRNRVRALEVTGVTVLTLCLMELALRTFPGVIPPALLIEFHPQLRSRAARGRFLTYDETKRLQRDDGGPPLRIIQPLTELHWYNSDRPGETYTARVDEIGFCNPPGSYNSTSTIDVITVGDSFTWCNSVTPAETWTARLAALTGQSTYNLGRGGTGPYEYLQILKRFGLKRHPRVVILAVYEGNDLRDVLETRAYRAYRSRTTSRERKAGFLERNSYLFNVLRSAADKASSRLARWTQKVPFEQDKPRQSQTIDFRYEVELDHGRYSFNWENTDREEVTQARRLFRNKIDLEVFSEALETFVQLAREHEFIPIVAYIPSAHTAYSEQVVFHDPDLSELMPWFSRRQRAFFERRGKESGYAFVDLSGALQSAVSTDSEPLLYFRGNLHLTPRGHAVVAEELRRVVTGLDRK